MSLSSSPPSDDAILAGSAETIPDKIVRVCSKCARPLSVGERMFYFLEAVNAPALCRICVLDQEREIIVPSPPPVGTGGLSVSGGSASPMPREPAPPDPPPPRRRPAIPLTTGTPADLDDTAAPDPTGSLPSGARQLRLAASHYVDEGRLDEAIECIRELALEIGLSRSGPVPVPPENPSGGVVANRASAAYGHDPGKLSAASSRSLSPAAGEGGTRPNEGGRAEAAPPSSHGVDPA